MRKIVVFDPSQVTDNLGDFIIMDAVNSALYEIFPEDYLLHVPTHDCPGKGGMEQIAKSPLSFVGGTNMLTSHWLWYRQWKLRLQDVFKVKNSVLCGVGWHKYQSVPDFVTAYILRSMLSKTYLHSVRDRYTQKHLNAIGIQNVVYTGCPTMWNLTPEHCATVPARKAKIAVMTVTEYLKNIEVDRQWMETVLKHYDQVYFWSQMFEDLHYAKSQLGDKVKVIAPTLAAYNQFLATTDCDFVGNRLHGGIRALQHGRRTLILEVDNRAAEIGRDTGLQTLPRADIAGIEQWINNPKPVSIKMPFDDIAKWKRQFAAAR